MLKETAEILTDEKFCFYVTEKTKTLFQHKKVKHEFTISGLNLFTMIRISKEVLTIDKEFNGSFNRISMQAISKHADTMIRIIAYAVLNADEEPSKKLLKRLSLLDAEALLDIISNVIKQLNLKPFMTSIISISGVNVMEMNPKEQGS